MITPAALFLLTLLATTAFTGIPATAAPSSSAVVRLIAFSPQVDPATAEGPFGLDYEIQFTTLENEMNGEFEFAPPEIPYDLTSTMVMEDPTLFETYYLLCAIDLPPLADANQNAIDDFFDLALEVPPTEVQGAYVSPVSGEAEPFTAVWSRPAQALHGTLTITLPDLGLTSTHAFRLYQYEGTFAFTPASTELEGQFTLTNWWDATDILTGSATLAIQDQNTLTWSPGTLESSSPFPYTFSYTPLDNFDLLSGGQYLSYVDVTDGYIGSNGADFNEWMAFIDGSDANANGIPDLVESEAEPVIPPSLAITLQEENITLTITGTPGTSYTLETSPDLTTWTDLQTLTTENSPLTLPANLPRQFLRLRTP